MFESLHLIRCLTHQLSVGGIWVEQQVALYFFPVDKHEGIKTIAIVPVILFGCVQMFDLRINTLNWATEQSHSSLSVAAENINGYKNYSCIL